MILDVYNDVDLDELLELLEFDLELEVREDMEALEVELDFNDTVDLEEFVVVLRVEELPDKILLELDELMDDSKLDMLDDEEFTVVLSKVVGVDFEITGTTTCSTSTSERSCSCDSLCDAVDSRSLSGQISYLPGDDDRADSDITSSCAVVGPTYIAYVPGCEPI